MYFAAQCNDVEARRKFILLRIKALLVLSTFAQQYQTVEYIHYVHSLSIQCLSARIFEGRSATKRVYPIWSCLDTLDSECRLLIPWYCRSVLDCVVDCVLTPLRLWVTVVVHCKSEWILTVWTSELFQSPKIDLIPFFISYSLWPNAPFVILRNCVVSLCVRTRSLSYYGTFYPTSILPNYPFN